MNKVTLVINKKIAFNFFSPLFFTTVKTVFMHERLAKLFLPQVSTMIYDLRDTFIHNLDQLDWMDSNTKKYAKEKVLPH